jgi:plasmid maintenance system antidote protein VapI
MSFLQKVGKYLFILIIFSTFSFIFYVNREKYIPIYENIKTYIGYDKPCSKPIIYFIDNFDPAFGQSKKEFEDNLNQATMMWNNVMGKELFKYSPDEAVNMSNLSKWKLSINLIYDKRQETTDKLKVIDSNIKNSKDSYENLKAQFDALKITYNNQKSNIQSMITSYELAKAEYQKNVSYWNNKGGVPKNQYTQLENDRVSLNNQAQKINEANAALNTTVNELNSLVNSLNSLTKDINQKIGTFNTVSTSNGSEFQEGEYVSDQNGQRINIYQYSNKTKLIRVLSHEFGHAIGLDHIDNPKAIMNAYNLDSSTNLSTDDISALRKICMMN